MRIQLTMAVLLSATTAAAQAPDYNRFALEAQFGLNNPVSPMASGYDSRTFGLFHAGLAGRYMLNNRFGIRLATGYDRFDAAGKSLPFTTDYLRVSAEGVINLANLLNFSQWTNNFGLLVHAGMGYSSMKGEGYDAEGWDQMLHAQFGITPQVRLSSRLALSVDLTVLAHAYQTRTYDYSIPNANPGIDGYLYNLSVGLQYSFGKHAQFADWVPSPDLAKELEESRNRIRLLEEQLKDDDADGVANYVDLEPGTMAGAAVNTKGETIPETVVVLDTDGDGVIDTKDICPTVKGNVATSGCPDSDDDGIVDMLDNCPNLKGVFANGGCPEIREVTKKVFDRALTGIQFETRKDVLTKSSYPVLNDIVEIMRRNPDYKLEITGHTDNVGVAADNYGLSERRANAVRNYLAANGIEQSRMTSRGMGDTQPVATNETEAGRAKNRRVEFVVKF